MHKLSHFLTFIGIGIFFAFISITKADYRVKRGEVTADYRCKNNGDCIKRGHAYCSFASGEKRDGVDVGWCHGNAEWKGSRSHPVKGHTKTSFHGGTHHNQQYQSNSHTVSKKTTWDYRCESDAECIKRGHGYCSFASAEQRNGVDVGWCQDGKPPYIYSPQTTAIPETTTTPKTTTTRTSTTTTTKKTTPPTTAYTTTATETPKPSSTTEFKVPETTILSDYVDSVAVYS